MLFASPQQKRAIVKDKIIVILTLVYCELPPLCESSQI